MLISEIKKQGTRGAFNWEQFDLLVKCSTAHDMTDWNEWRRHHPKQPILLQNANMEKAWLRGADLRNADFRGASLRGADLSGARRRDFSRRWADLEGADFTEADLCGTDFRGANLSGADFSRAYLFYTNLSWTNLSGASFNEADLWAFLYRANLAAIDLCRANRRRSDFTEAGCRYAKTGKTPWGAFINVSETVPDDELAFAVA